MHHLELARLGLDEELLDSLAADQQGGHDNWRGSQHANQLWEI